MILALDIGTSSTRAILYDACGSRIEGAGHTQSWNYDPDRYEDALRRWLVEVVLDP